MRLNSFLEMLMNFKKFYRLPNLHLSRGSINKNIEMLISNYFEEIKSKELELIKCLDPNLPAIDIDEKQMDEVFLNLLLNAIYFAPEKSRLEFETVRVEKGISVSISNEGPHIPEENLNKIFLPFFTTKSSGSGLGLSIVNNIVNAHKGKITVVNRISGGVIFKIFLPIET